MQVKKYTTPQGILAPSYFSSLSAVPAAATWEQVLVLIASDPTVERNTAAARQALADGDSKLYSRLKAQSGAITPCGQFEGGHRADQLVALTGLLMLDYDHVDPALLPALKERAAADPHTFLCHTTCSGQGLRVLAPYTSPDAQVAYLRAWRWAAEYYNMVLDLKADEATKDITRLSFLCHDPEAALHPAARPFVVGDADTPYLPDTDRQQEPFAFADGILQRQGIAFADGHRHHYIREAAFLLNKMGVAQEETAARYAALHDDPAEVQRLVAWVYSHAAAQHGSWRPRQCRASAPAATPRRTATERPAQPVGRESKASKLDALTRLADHVASHIRLRHNTVTTLTEMQQDDGSWADLDDRHLNSLWLQTCDVLQVYVSQSDFAATVNSCTVDTFDPFGHYFAALPPDDGRDHIAELAARVHTTAPDGLFERCFRKWLVAMVASWLDPSVMNHTILTLIGPQGCYKSTFLRRLLPPELGRYFMAKLGNGYLSKDDKIAISCYGLIAMEELDAMRDSDLAALKAAITTEVVSERAAYARLRQNRPHLASFCATGNNRYFLTDISGHRRFLPFEVTAIDSPFDYDIPYRELYAQCLALVRSGFHYWFSPDEERELAPYKAQFETPCLEYDLATKYFRPAEKYECPSFFTVSEIMARCEADLRGRLSATRMGQVLSQRLGYEARKRNGRRGYLLVERTYDEISQERLVPQRSA